MHIQAGERLRLTLWGAGCRAMVSLNAYGVTQAAVMGMDPAQDGFTYDVTAWLHDGCNTLTVVLIGAPGDVPFRMRVARDGQADWTLDEADFLPLDTPWRLWTMPIEREAPRAGAGAYGQAPDALPIRMSARLDAAPIPVRSVRTDWIAALPTSDILAIPDQPST